MGAYVNPPVDEFADWLRSKYYVDKTDLIRLTNSAIGVADDKRIVVSRPRRFGKTFALSMLAAYYSRGFSSEKLFQGQNISNDPTFEEHLNNHNVILLDIQGAYIGAKRAGRIDDFGGYISELVNYHTP